MRPNGQQQCIPFAFAIATTKAAEHWSGRFSEIKILQCPKWALRPFRFLLRALLLLCHNTTPYCLMNLIWQRLSSRFQTTPKQWCITNEYRMNRAQQGGEHWRPQPDQ